MPNRALRAVVAFGGFVAVADATKELVPAPGVGKRIVLLRINGTVTVTAAQTGTIGDGTTVAIELGVSTPVGTQIAHEWPMSGLPLAENTALGFAGTAGYRLNVSGEYYIEHLWNAA